MLNKQNNFGFSTIVKGIVAKEIVFACIFMDGQDGKITYLPFFLLLHLYLLGLQPVYTSIQ